MTTAPAPTIAPKPISRPGRIVALAPIDAPARTTVSSLAFEPLPAARKAIVCEGRIRSYEHVILEHDSIPELDSALDGHSIADDHLALDKNAVADIAVLADTRSLEHVGKGPDARTRADCVALA